MSCPIIIARRGVVCCALSLSLSLYIYICVCVYIYCYIYGPRVHAHAHYHCGHKLEIGGVRAYPRRPAFCREVVLLYAIYIYIWSGLVWSGLILTRITQ